MFNKRQLLGLELSCRHIVEVEDSEVRNALATNLSDLLRYQNMLCRYDTMALKSLDIFSIHGYPVGLIQCESNILGIRSEGSYSANIGSGGWGNMVEKYVKAKEFCERPFEVQKREGRKMRVAIPEEWIGETRTGIRQTEHREVPLFCGNAGDLVLPTDSLDAVFTDPPYYGNVQYAELMDFCYVWLRRLISDPGPIFEPASTRNAEELTGNQTMDRGYAHFTQGLSKALDACLMP